MLKLKLELVGQPVFYAVCAIWLALAMPLTADAAEKGVVQTKRHKAVVQNSHQKPAKLLKPRKAAQHPRKSAAKTSTQRKAILKPQSSSLKLSRNIESPAQASPQARETNQSIQTKPKPVPNLSDPPLQIGKTLYQRNGEIRQLE